MSQVLQRDCLEYMRGCPDNFVDLILADPPYYRIHGEFDFFWKTPAEYLDWSKIWVAEAVRILKPTGSFYLWGKIGHNLGYSLFRIADWIESNDLLKVRNWITQRNVRGRGNKRGYMECREELLFMTKTDRFTWHPAYTSEPSRRKDLGFDGKPRKNRYKRCSDVWIDIPEASQSSLERFRLSNGETFPTVKALRLCDRIIQASSNPGDLVYIPFGGSGSEAVSAYRLGRQSILTETNPLHIELIQRRLKQEGAVMAAPSK